MQEKKTLNNSVERAFDILEVLNREGPMRCVEIAKYLNTATNTANNMLRTLFRRGYLSQNEDGRYMPGPACFFLSSGNNYINFLHKTANPEMMSLSALTGDNVFLGIELNGELIIAVRVEGSNPIKVSEDSQQWKKKIHATGSGKILMAEKGIDWFKAVCGGVEPERLTDHTITDWKAIEKEIRKIKEKGFAECRDESTEGISAIGVPVRDKYGKVFASLAQSFPTFFVDSGKININERVETLFKSSNRISNEYIKQQK